MTQPLRAERRYEVTGHRPYLVELHLDDCDCPHCEAMRERDEPTWHDGPALRAFREAGWLAGLGILIGSAIAFLIDPHGAWLALTTVFTGGR